MHGHVCVQVHFLVDVPKASSYHARYYSGASQDPAYDLMKKKVPREDKVTLILKQNKYTCYQWHRAPWNPQQGRTFQTPGERGPRIARKNVFVFLQTTVSRTMTSVPGQVTVITGQCLG